LRRILSRPSTKSNRQLVYPDTGSGDKIEFVEVYGFAVESGGEASSVFEFIKAAFDMASLFVELSVVGGWAFAISFGLSLYWCDIIL